MSQRRTEFLGWGILIILLAGIGFLMNITFKVDEQSKQAANDSAVARQASQHAKEQSIQNNKDIMQINNTLVAGQEKANIRGNSTLVAISQVVGEILNVATQNSMTEKNVIGNLTDHRIVNNQTRDMILDELNKTNNRLCLLQVC